MLELEPRKVWEHFENLSKIPRPSGKEEKAAEYVVSVAKAHSLEWERDAVGNVLVRVPATPGHEGAPVTVLQGHLDMVCEKNSGTVMDFHKDPLQLRVVGGVVKATDTTLGADNGIGVAMTLALLDEPAAVHGPLEFLFTIDEERGLTGANGLARQLLKGRRLINTDTEEDGALYVGCAGGKDTQMSLRIGRLAKKDPRKAYKLAVTGLRGGHSGSDINEGRGNANRIVARLLQEWEVRGVPYALVAVDGGSKRNAIPRECFAVLHLDDKDVADATRIMEGLQKVLREELAGVDEGVTLSLAETQTELPPLAPGSQRKLVLLLGAVPHGLVAYSREIPHLVETSTNFAIVQSHPGKVDIFTSQRSSVMSQLDWAAQWVANVGLLAGAQIRQSDGYPGWKPNLESPILKAAQETYQKLHGTVPEPKAIHAGLECGIIGDKYPGMDMVSLGPEIRNAHSPDEEVHIESVRKTYHFLLELLKDLA